MQKKTTPQSLFDHLVDYPFPPHYVSVDGELTMHYVDEGEGPIILLLHGEPSWSYLYRKMIPILVSEGHRVIAPDLIGFGKSDKPAAQSDYSYKNHLKWLTSFITELDLKEVHLFCQDWGGLLGLFIAANHSERFKSIVAANTFLPNSKASAPEAFKKWREFSQKVPDFSAGDALQMGTESTLSEAVVSSYNTPYPDDSFKSGARIFPLLVPFGDDDPYNMIPACDQAWEGLMSWEKPFLTLFSDSDPIMHGLEKVFQKLVPGCKGQPHQIIENAGHFLQEDKGEELATLLNRFIKTIQ